MKIPFISYLKNPACALKRDVLELATLRYNLFYFTECFFMTALKQCTHTSYIELKIVWLLVLFWWLINYYILWHPWYNISLQKGLRRSSHRLIACSVYIYFQVLIYRYVIVISYKVKHFLSQPHKGTLMDLCTSIFGTTYCVSNIKAKHKAEKRYWSG